MLSKIKKIKYFVVCLNLLVYPTTYLRLKAPGASLRQKSVFGLHPLMLPIFLLFLLLILLLFLYCLLTNSLIQLFPIITFLV